MWIGQIQLGLTLDVPLQTSTAAGLPTLPDQVPSIQVRQASDNAIVYAGLMPIVDHDLATFSLPLFLGLGFAVGSHTIRMAYSLSGSQRSQDLSFIILPGGEQRGQVLGMAYYHRPDKDWIVWQAEVGLLLTGKNPRAS